MTIDEAIERLKRDVKDEIRIGFVEYAEFLSQIIKWLEEFKKIKEMDMEIPQHFTKEQIEWIKAYCIKRNIEFYNKAIDDFVEKANVEIYNDFNFDDVGEYSINDVALTLYRVAEQLKR